MLVSAHSDRTRPKTKWGALITALLVAAFATPMISTGQVPKQPLTGQPRSATLQELYAMFFTYADHVETKSVADEALGLDRTFYRQHLQMAAGLNTDEYAQALASAHRFVEVDSYVRSQIAVMIDAATVNNQQITSLFAQRDSSLNSEISNLRQILGQERSSAFESYLQNEYIQQGVNAPENKTTNSSQTMPPTSSSYAAPSVATAPPPSAATSSRALSMAAATPATVVITGAQVCKSGYTLFYNGSYTICADSQLSYTGSGEVEPYAHMYAYWNNLSLNYLEIQGYFYVNNVFNDSLGCHQYYPTGTFCDGIDAVWNYGNGALYQWQGVTTISDYDPVCVVPADCSPTSDYVWSDVAQAQIYYPDINYISPSSVNPGSSGSFTIDGEGLISPFQNPPTVTVTNQGSVFSSFYVQSFNYAAGTITVGYAVQSSAPAGTQTVTVNNGFGSGTVSITVVGAPVIDDADGSPITSSSTSPVQVLAGQQVSLSVTAPSGETIERQSWSFGNSGDVVAGFNASDGTVTKASGAPVSVTATTGSSLTSYFIVPGATETITVNVTYSSGATASTTEWYYVDGPTGISVSNLDTVAPVQILPASPVPPYAAAIALGDGSETETAGPNYGIAVQAATSHVPSNVGSNSRFQWVNLITNIAMNVRESGVDQPIICQSSVPLPALDSTYPDFVGEIYSDAPSFDLPPDFGELEGADAFRTYLMWDPALPTGCQPDESLPGNPPCSSIPIPLGSFTWSWSGDAINTLTNQSNQSTFTQECGTEMGEASTFVKGPSFPQWAIGAVLRSGLVSNALTCTPPLQ